MRKFLSLDPKIIFAGVVAAVISAALQDSEWHAETVARDLAEYCPADGEWAWKGECE